MAKESKKLEGWGVWEVLGGGGVVASASRPGSKKVKGGLVCCDGLENSPTAAGSQATKDKLDPSGLVQGRNMYTGRLRDFAALCAVDLTRHDVSLSAAQSL